MKRFLLLALSLTFVVSEITPETAHDAFAALPLFEEFIVKYNRSYSSRDEYERRFSIFVSNLRIARERNIQEGEEVFGVTQFSDLTPLEFKKYLGFFPRPHNAPIHVAEPKRLQGRPMCSSSTDCNYATLGAVTPVKDQGQCGSCWAFSATEATETAWWFAGNALPVLSPQEIVDCDKTDGGCNGGDTPTAYQFIINEGGLESDASYPYTARDGTCKFDKTKVVASISSYQWAVKPCNTFPYSCTNQDEAGLWTFVQNQGPASICVDAEPWQLYVKGIYSGTACKNAYYDLDHCVHLTGYGVDGTTKYWLVKNSWGASWGEQGYIRLEYGVNMCGVADEATIAVV